MPWYIEPLNSKQLVFYNSVGGTNCDELQPEIAKSLLNVIEDSCFFTVRDNKTRLSLQKLGCKKKISVLPDTAIIMERLFSINELNDLASAETTNILKELDQYYIVQVNEDVGEKYYKILAKAIHYIYKKTHIKCILLPIGRAALHSDQIYLAKINSRTKDESVLVKNNTIFDTMLLIANARCFMGTSLHGLITASSFHVPHTAISKNVPKVISFLKTWNTTQTLCVLSYDELLDFFYNNESLSYENINNIETAKDRVDLYFKQMFSMIVQE